MQRAAERTPDVSPTAYKGYNIRQSLTGETFFVQKYGERNDHQYTVASVSTLDEAKKAIDLLTD